MQQLYNPTSFGARSIKLRPVRARLLLGRKTGYSAGSFFTEFPLMPPVLIIALYAVFWWLVFFMLLPIGVRVSGQVEQGHASSAPENPNLWLKALGAMLIAAIVTAGFDYLVIHDFFGLISVRPSEFR
jgi:predicted secreted protein